MTYTQEVSTVVRLSDRIIKECPRALTRRLKFKQGDVHDRMNGNLIALVWKDK